MPLRLRTRSKYGAVPTRVDGRRFDSLKEAHRYGELMLLAKAGQIHDLVCQPEFPLLTTRYKGAPVFQVGKYIADFRYREGPSGLSRIEDVKSPATKKTAVYRLKKRRVENAYGIEITEI